MSQPYDEERVAAELRHTAASFEPDTERIRRLMDARMAPSNAWRSASRGVLVPFRRGAGSGSSGHGTARAGHHRLRPLLWSAVGTVAAASVILAISAFGAAPGLPGLGLGRPEATITIPAGAPTGGFSSSTGSSSTPATGSSPAAGRSNEPSIIGDPTSEGTPPPVTPPSLTSSSVASPTARTVTSATATATPGLHHTEVGNRDITIYVKPVPAGRTAHLGQATGEQWVVPAAVESSGQLHNRGSNWAVGPVQVMGHGGAIHQGPYSVNWRDGQTEPVTGASRNWLTVPQSAEGVPSALRVPVRFHTVPVTATLLTGTIGGRGLLVASLPGDQGSSGGTMRIDLPGCSDVCAVLVTVTVRPVNSGSPSSGDLTLDLMAAAPNVMIGLAGVSMS